MFRGRILKNVLLSAAKSNFDDDVQLFTAHARHFCDSDYESKMKMELSGVTYFQMPSTLIILWH